MGKSRAKQKWIKARVRNELLIVFVWKKKMVSEDVEKILALVIVTLSFLSLPVLLFFFVLVLYIDATYVIQFYHTGELMDALVAVLLTTASAGLFLILRYLIKWIRKK